MSATIPEAVANVPKGHWWSISERKIGPQSNVRQYKKGRFFAAIGRHDADHKKVAGYGEAEDAGDALQLAIVEEKFGR